MTYQLIWKNTSSTILTLSRLNLIINSPCPGWRPCSATGSCSAFERTEPSFTPFFDDWQNPTRTIVTSLFIIDLILEYGASPFSIATIENCKFHNFSVIIGKRDFVKSWTVSEFHFRVSQFIKENLRNVLTYKPNPCCRICPRQPWWNVKRIRDSKDKPHTSGRINVLCLYFRIVISYVFDFRSNEL